MKTILMGIFMIIASQFCIAQNTTELEYNYMKKGYRQVEESGMDVKKGYSTEQMYKDDFGNDVTLTLTLLKRDDGTHAGIIIKSESKAAFGSGLNYYCIPAVSKSFGWPQFIADINTMTSGVRNYILRAVSLQLMLEMEFKK